MIIIGQKNKGWLSWARTTDLLADLYDINQMKNGKVRKGHTRATYQHLGQLE
jgi:hypothetical protein